MTALAVLSILVTVSMIWGCGKKGPPKPPTGSMPPSIRDLAHSISNNTVELSWTIPQPDEKARLPITGFLIYRSQQPELEAACPNCPILYKNVGDVPARGPGSDPSGKIVDNLYPNHRTRLPVCLQGPRIQYRWNSIKNLQHS